MTLSQLLEMNKNKSEFPGDTPHDSPNQSTSQEENEEEDYVKVEVTEREREVMRMLDADHDRRLEENDWDQDDPTSWWHQQLIGKAQIQPTIPYNEEEGYNHGNDTKKPQKDSSMTVLRNLIVFSSRECCIIL